MNDFIEDFIAGCIVVACMAFFGMVMWGIISNWLGL